MITDESIDHRLFERFPARFPAKFKDARDAFGSVLNLRDASAFGARLTTKEKLFKRDIITIEVSVSDGHAPMVLKGEVVWSKAQDLSTWDVGVKLNKVDFILMTRLYKFVAPKLHAE